MVRWVSKPQEETKSNTVYTVVKRILISKNGDRVLHPNTVPDPSDGAGGCAAKSYRQNFCSILPGRAAVTLSICAEKILCPAKIGLLLGLELSGCSFDTAIQVDVYFTCALEN